MWNVYGTGNSYSDCLLKSTASGSNRRSHAAATNCKEQTCQVARLEDIHVRAFLRPYVYATRTIQNGKRNCLSLLVRKFHYPEFVGKPESKNASRFVLVAKWGVMHMVPGIEFIA